MERSPGRNARAIARIGVLACYGVKRKAYLRIHLRRLRNQVREAGAPEWRRDCLPRLRAGASDHRAFHVRRPLERKVEEFRGSRLPRPYVPHSGWLLAQLIGAA